MRISFDLPDDKATRIIDGFCVQHGYQATIIDPVKDTTIPNPETKNQFARRMVIEFVKESARAGEIQLEAAKARQAAVVKASEMEF